MESRRNHGLLQTALSRLPTRLILAASLVFGAVSCTKDAEQAKLYHFKRGNEYFAEGKLDEASIEFRNAIQIDSRFAEALYQFGLCELERKNLENALRALREVVTLQPERLDARLKLAEVYLIAHRVDPRHPPELVSSARLLVEGLPSTGVEAYETLQLMAQVALAEKRFEDAVEDLRTAHQLRPDQPEVVIGLTQALISTGRGAEAEELARRFLQNSGSPGPLYDALYTYYVSQQRLSEALEMLTEKIAAHPESPLPRLQLAAHYARTGQENPMRAALQGILDDGERFPAGRLHVGDFYASLERWDDAVGLYEAGALEDGERRGEYQKRLMRALIAQGSREKAGQVLDQALAENPNDRDTRAMKAMLLAADGGDQSLDVAVVEWKKLTEEEPDNAVYLYYLGQTLRTTGDLNGAQECFQQSITKNWSFVPPRVALVEISLQNGRFRDALSIADEALKLSPEHRQARLVRAISLTALERYGEARTELEEMLQGKPNDAAVQYHLARLHTKQGNYREAENILATLYAAGATDPQIIISLAEVSQAQGQSEKVRQLLVPEIEKRPNSVPLRKAAAEAALQSGDTASALAQYRQLVEQDPTSAEALFDLANAYNRTRQFEQALQYAERAAALAPDRAGPRLLAAVALEQLGRGDEAEKRYRSVLDKDPSNAIALNNLAFRLAESDALNESLILAQRAVSLHPAEADLNDTLGWVYLKMDMSDAALRIFNQLVAQHPENAVYRYHLGAALMRKGDVGRARQELQAALSTGPSAAEETAIRALLAQRP